MTSAPYSILFGSSRPDGVDATPEPDYFRDLRLDQVVAVLTGSPDQFRLASLYHAMLDDPATLRLRQDVFDDVADGGTRATLDRFSAGMASIHNALRAVASLQVQAQQDRWHLNAAATYCATLHALADGLSTASSEGLREIGRRVRDITESTDFHRLEQESARLEDDLGALRYGVYLQGGKITVGGYDGEPDYGEQVVALFARFRQEAPVADREEQQRQRRVKYAGGDPVRERIVGLVARLHPQLFADLAAFRTQHPDFLDPLVSLFYREIQFYLRYDDLRRRLERAGMPMVRPELRDGPGLEAQDVYDLALANVAGDRAADAIVGNDLSLTPDERRVVITGPNQGGKTTFSRTIGQLHHLAALGCPVPGRAVSLAVPDRIFTHYEREELGHRTGKLEDDLLRLQAILEHATRDSVVILNEIFASTTTADAVELARGVLGRLEAGEALCVCVTFLDEIAQLPHTVTLVAQVDPDDVARRTFRVIRAAADGRAYATALAAKHGLTYDDVKRRVR